MNIACAKRSHFCPCDGSEQGNPLANLTSEAPDEEVFLSNRNYNYPDLPTIICSRNTPEELANCPPFPPDCDPIIGCPPICPSNACPPQKNPCGTACPPHSCTPSSPCPPCNCPTVVYYNRETSCTSCGFTYTVPAGRFSSTISQADADAQAQSVCEYRACHGPDGHNRRPAGSCSVSPVISTYGQVSPVIGGVGENVTLSITYFYPGTLPLTFLWYKDGTPFQLGTVAGTTVSLVLNNLTLGDAGTYVLGIKPQGCPEIFSNPIELQIVGCNCSTAGHLPTDLLVDDNTIVVTFMGNVTAGPTFNNETTFNCPPGVFELQYNGGSALECEHNLHNVGDCNSSANRSIAEQSCDVWVDNDGDSVVDLNLANVIHGADVPEIGNIPPNTCQHGAALAANQEGQFFVDHPDGKVPGLTDFIPKVGFPLRAGTIRCAPIGSFPLWPLGTVCGDQSPCPTVVPPVPPCPATNNTSFSLRRIKRWADQPVLTIKDFNIVAPLIIPADHVGAPYPDQWAGVFNEEAIITSRTACRYAITAVSWGIDNILVNQSEVRTLWGPFGFWRLRIWGNWTDSFAVNHIELLWEGRKFKDNNGRGSYCYFSSFNPAGSVPDCIILI